MQWIGGYDENEGRDNPDGTAIMIATSRRILPVRVGDRLRPIRPNIEYPECLTACRRDTIACVADSKSYALLEIEHQQKIPLFPITSAPELDASQIDESPAKPQQGPGHGRSKSLGDFVPSADTLNPAAAMDRSQSPAQPAQREPSPSQPSSRPRSSTAETSPAGAPRREPFTRPLPPHILSPSSNEFMLTTGTSPSEPGVGMFVNLDGDVSRGTIEFDRYPEAVLACSFSELSAPTGDADQEQLIVALLEKPYAEHLERGLQIQSLVAEGDSGLSKTWLKLPENGTGPSYGHAGLHRCLSIQRHTFSEVADLLCAVRYQPDVRTKLKPESDPRTKSTIERLEQENALFDTYSNGSTNPSPEYDAQRAAEELKFVQRLGHTTTQTLTWSNGNLWHLLANPLLLQLENQISITIASTELGYDFTQVKVSQILSFLGSVREREPQNETEFLSIKYARQKASVVLFLHLLSGIDDNSNLKAACKLAESALIEGELDPRLPLSLLQPISREVIYGSTGIWIQQGIIDCFTNFKSPIKTFEQGPTEFWIMFRHYLSAWQEKRGASGSLSDEKAIFDSVDAALLHLLLYLDSDSSQANGAQAPTRAKLNNIVDHWKGDFERAVTLLEHYKRLYILSRLYQSRKSSKNVLQTWKRICEGDENADKDVTADHIYAQMRKYLAVLRDQSLVHEYAIWLAQRSPNLAVQLLSDDHNKVTFAPAEVVTTLKAHAPGSVQLFLEHLVFDKNLDQYADDLVGYYLDSVLSVLESSQEARQSLADSYTTYRALTAPKPTYLNFIKENAPNEAWWQSRLRLLQLLGTGAYAHSAESTSSTNKTLTYSIDKVLDRLAPFSTFLVSECIILDARQGRHNEALKLLVHGLGDYDTAIRYCYFGGPTAPSGTIDASLLPPREHQAAQFQVLFGEFLAIKDIEECLDRTSHLLGNFATWFDPLEIFQIIPDSWSVSLLSEFLLRTFRATTSERNQAIIVKALSAAQNLQKQAELINICEKIGARFEGDTVEDEQDKGNGNGDDGSIAQREASIVIS